MWDIEKFGVQSDDVLLLMKALDEGAVNLLTGAGASWGVTGGDGQELKGGADVARELNTKFGLENQEPDCSNLQLVYGDIAAIPGNLPQLADFLKARFLKCSVPWQREILKFPWKRIWTLNIDDVLQRAYKIDDKRTLRSSSWDDPLQVRMLAGEELQVIYLHGRASQIEKTPARVIFSLKDYAARQEVAPGWHSEFRSEFIRKPFIVCGARLRDEFDLATVLEIGNRSRERGGCPSFIVLLGFSPGEESRFRRQGLVPIAAAGDDFFKALFSDYSKYLASQPGQTSAFHAATAVMRSSFRLLLPNLARPRKMLDFYSSAEAQWHHIVDGLDAFLEGPKQAARWLQENSTNSRVVLIGGGPVCGKTSSALRIALELQKQGHETWLFRGEERFDEMSLLNYLSIKKSAVLIFDDCADFSNSFTELIKAANLQGIVLRIVATADSWRLRGVHADLLDAEVNVVDLEPVSRKNFEGIFYSRKSKGRLGRCTGMKPEDAWADFRDHFNRRSLEWFESLEGALPYRQAISAVMAGAGSTAGISRNLMLTCAATHRFGFSLPFQFAAALSGGVELEDVLQSPNPYSDLAYLDEHGLRLRSRSFAAYVWELATQKEKYDISLYLAKNLSPLIVPKAISRRTYPYRILRELMDCDVVARDIPQSADRWYSDLLPLMSWNSRYWEQRALLAARREEDEMAYSFAKSAVEIQSRDAFPHTTLGTICMQISVRRADEVGIDRFWEGVRELDISRQLARDQGNEWEHPFVTFFSYALRVCRVHPSQFDRIEGVWKDWMRAAEGTRLFRFDRHGQQQLEGFRRQWLGLAIKPRLDATPAPQKRSRQRFRS